MVSTVRWSCIGRATSKPWLLTFSMENRRCRRSTLPICYEESSPSGLNLWASAQMLPLLGHSHEETRKLSSRPLGSVGDGTELQFAWLRSRQAPLKPETNRTHLLLGGPLHLQARAVSSGFGECRNAGQLRCWRNVARFRVTCRFVRSPPVFTTDLLSR
jgi:hypothetical protein